MIINKMEKKIIFENIYLEASYIKEFKLAQIIWKPSATVPSESYRNGINKLLNHSEEEEIVYFLSDGRKNGVITTEDRKWFQDFAVSEAAKKGLKGASVVIKPNPFKKYYMNAILKVVNKDAPYQMKIFYEYDDALNWLISLKEHL